MLNEGSLAVFGHLGGGLQINPGTTLSGTGTVGTTINSGNIHPGASIGTLNINGNFTQNASGELLVELNDAGASDRLNISGIANLAGTLRLDVHPGVYLSGTEYSIITAALVNGTFDNLLENHPLDFAVQYFNNLVKIVIPISEVILPVPTGTLKHNAKAVASNLFCNGAIPTGDLLYVAREILALAPNE